MEIDRDQEISEEVSAESPPTDSESTSTTPTAASEEAAQEAAEGSTSEVSEGDATALEELRAEFDSLQDRYLRLAAEFENYRRRIEREREEYRIRAQADLIVPLLELIDDLQRVVGLDLESTTVESLLEGVELIEKKFLHTLESKGLEPIEAEGQSFDPITMEALMTIEAESPEEDDLVADIFQTGYRFHEILIRPARVRVKKYES